MQNPNRILKRESCFKWIRLFLSAALTFSVSAFTIIYTIQQGIRDDVYREREQQDMATSRKQLIYDSYFEELSQHLLTRLNVSGLTTKSYIRSKTLNVLPHLDTLQKTELILFLYENQLLRSDYPEMLIDLSNADLTGCHFQSRCSLTYISLSGIIADNITFENCLLERAVFSGSSMVGARFISSRGAASHFDSVNLTNAIFIDFNNLRINFENAILVGSSFKDGPLFVGVRFVNTDLYQSDISDVQLYYEIDGEQNTVLNTRLPDGSFSQINTSQLIYDGNAELSVSFIFKLLIYSVSFSFGCKSVKIESLFLIGSWIPIIIIK